MLSRVFPSFIVYKYKTKWNWHFQVFKSETVKEITDGKTTKSRAQERPKDECEIDSFADASTGILRLCTSLACIPRVD